MVFPTTVLVIAGVCLILAVLFKLLGVNVDSAKVPGRVVFPHGCPHCWRKTPHAAHVDLPVASPETDVPMGQTVKYRCLKSKVEYRVTQRRPGYYEWARGYLDDARTFVEDCPHCKGSLCFYTWSAQSLHQDCAKCGYSYMSEPD